MQKPERRIVITIFVNPVLAAKEDSVRDKAEGIGGDILPVLVRGEREVVALLLVTGNTFFSQYPDVVLLVFGNLINQVVEKRVRVVCLVFVSFQFVPVELSQSLFGTYPYETLLIPENTAHVGRQPFFQRDLFKVIVFCPERENTD